MCRSGEREKQTAALATRKRAMTICGKKASELDSPRIRHEKGKQNGQPNKGTPSWLP